MKRTPLSRRTPLRRVAKRRARELRVYSRERAKFLKRNPWCQFPRGCQRPSAVVHHKRGRFGGRLNDRRWWAASCIEHNDYAETHTGEALAIGWLIPIEGAPA